MAYTGEQLLKKISSAPIVPVFSNTEKATALAVVKACYDAGITVFEFTNRNKQAFEVFEYLLSQRDQFPGLALGIGTIMDEKQASQYIDAGADFIVSPILDQQVAELCAKNNISWTPGCGTLTEIIQGERWGATLIKVFPADVMGPKFIAGVKGPCPHLNLMPTGGVTPDEEELKTWFRAGVVCVGMGSQLMDKQLISSGNFKALSQNIKEVLDFVNELRN
jgi:2-dehydro-3-deoxyphosphogluconate aldolase/(4S)-4-hydroxy-2-oxoglutarate aldolase